MTQTKGTRKPSRAEELKAKAIAAASYLPQIDEPEQITQEEAPEADTTQTTGNDNQTQNENDDNKPPKKKRKHLRSAYLDDEVYEQLAELAEYRSFFKKERNSRNQPVGYGTLLNEAAVEFLERHMDELNTYRQRAGK